MKIIKSTWDSATPNFAWPNVCQLYCEVHFSSVFFFLSGATWRRAPGADGRVSSSCLKPSLEIPLKRREGFFWLTVHGQLFPLCVKEVHHGGRKLFASRQLRSKGEQKEVIFKDIPSDLTSQAPTSWTPRGVGEHSPGF